jgi:hypothetical protein
LDKDLEDDPRVVELAEELARQIRAMPSGEFSGQLEALARDAVLGGLYRFWRHADTYLRRHDRITTASRGFARLQDVTGLPASLLRAFPPEWLVEHDAGVFELPGYAAKNAIIDKDQRREKTRLRTRAWRARKRKDASCDANPGVTIEASQRHKSVTTGPGTGPGPEPDPPEPGPDPGPSPRPSPESSAASLSLAGASSAAQAPEGELTDDQLRLQVLTLRALKWSDARILEKWSHRGMTPAHLANGAA